MKKFILFIAVVSSGSLLAQTNFSGGMSYNGGGGGGMPQGYAGAGGYQMPQGSLAAVQPGAIQVPPRGVGEQQAYAMTPSMGCGPRGSYSGIEGPIRGGVAIDPSGQDQHR